MTNLVKMVLSAAMAQGISQKELASRISISPETLSRAKRRGSLASDTLEKAAKAANLVLRVGPAPKPLKLSNASSHWSGRNAIESARAGNTETLELL